ncbi:putative ABC transport system permease protein [Pseudosporangium ferrugineum]|uniref:Putative ABC transport system permease protein n=1 Tax=Pseudosporangium ferrugineum TaxID=439699 RepID=A0A2T0SEH7_9ACTN|nr:putative ABC transport system permease protein [Pseudosporangium ferrugineum]
MHWPSVRGRARADAGPLLLVAAVVTAVTLLAGAAPPLLRATADDAVRDAVRSAGQDAEIVSQSHWSYDDVEGGRGRVPTIADDVDYLRERAGDALDPGLRAALRPPVAVVTGPSLDVTDGSLLRTFRFMYLADDRGPHSATRVTWIAGVPPRSSAPASDPDFVLRPNSPPWPVQVGLSEADAAALKLGPGDRIPLKDKFRRVRDVRISGIFRATDSSDPTWRLAPGLLNPASSADGVGITRLGGLLSPESLPDARLAVDSGDLDRGIHFEPDADRIDADSARRIAATLVTLKAISAAATDQDETLQWQTQLDKVLSDVQTRVNAATAQASVLLVSVLAGTVLVLMLAAALLARRRAVALTAARQRGAGLTDLAVELLIESAAVALTAAALGLVLARLVAPGVSWGWAIPVVVAAAAAGPAYGVTLAARATRDKRQPANRSARRHLHRTALLRRAALEFAVVVAAAGAMVALHQRGILESVSEPAGALDAWKSQGDTAVLGASAPALGVLVGALVLVRLLPPALRLALRRALRSRHPMRVFGTAQAAATGARILPLLALVVCAALATFALTVGTTADRGLADAAWRTVGADARVDAGPSSGVDVPALARRIAAAPGVRQAVTAQVIEGARVTNGTGLLTPRFVIVDSGAYRRLLSTTPLPDTPALAGLAGRAAGDVPVLVRSADGSMRPGTRLALPREDMPAVPLTAVGEAPAIGDTGDTIVVDAAALTAAGIPVVPDTIWVTGPGAARAVSGIAAVDTVSRTDVLRERRTAPLTAGLLRLAWLTAAVLIALGLLSLALAAAASAPQRWQTLGRLRTLGLRLRDGRWVAAGELLPPVAVAAVAGPPLGVLLAVLTVNSLDLRLLVGWDGDPALAVPWWQAGVAAVVLLAAVAAVVAAETALRRRSGLNELLRVGG